MDYQKPEIERRDAVTGGLDWLFPPRNPGGNNGPGGS